MNLKPHRKLLPLAIALLSLPAMAVVPGATAPDFKGTDSTGAQHTLSQYRGKFVVLEWANQGCPYDRKHYLSGSMESLQRTWTAKGVVWLSIISSGVGQQGYVNPAEENEYLKKMHAAPTAAILDPTSTIARLYEAKTTPHIFVIDPTGKLIYQGAIDDKPTTDQADLKGARNYLSETLTEAMSGQPIQVASTRPYGCSVKYATEEPPMRP
jgi:AhpC/TSA family